MKVRITLEIDNHARRGINAGAARQSLATRDEVIQEILAVWTAHLDDLHEQAEVNDGEDEEQ